jgi:hypothetical protein
MKIAFEIDDDLKPDTKLFRYIRIETFMSFMETKQFLITNVNTWDDKWEVVLSKLPIQEDNGEVKFPLYSFHERLYGQSWSLVPESDAMWRIYSPFGTGIQIATSVEKFRLISGMVRCRLGRVIYFQSTKDLLQKASSRKSPFDEALYKRNAFAHEQEVRFLTHGDFINQFDAKKMHIGLSVDPFAFIEGVTIDPRADNWYVDTVMKYCERIGLPIKPIKSNLYESEPHRKLGLVRKYIAVKKDEEV